MLSRIRQLAELYAKTEKELEDELGKLPNEGQPCDCDDREVIKFVHEGNLFDEVLKTCLNCGGYVDEA